MTGGAIPRGVRRAASHAWKELPRGAKLAAKLWFPIMLPNRLACALTLLATVFNCASLSGEELPTIPVGLDAYRQWDRWPQQRIGARAYMRSTYDRQGRNHSADA